MAKQFFASPLLIGGFLALLSLSAKAEVKIGVAGPFTGPEASFGAQLRMGTEQAVEDINAKGGILGQKIVLEIGDDASDPKQGVDVANKFVGDQVSFVIGHFNSGITIPASTIYNENNILEITPASANPLITERGLDLIFRISPRNDREAPVAAKFIASLGDKKIAILHDKTVYGKGIADEVRKDLAAMGIKDVLYDAINRGDKDYSAIVSKIKASGAELLYFGGYHTEAGLLVRQMHDQGMTTVMVVPTGVTSQEFATIGGPAAIGTYMTFVPDPRELPESQEVVKEFKAKNFDPETWTLYSYAAVQVIKQAAEAAHSLEPEAIAKIMHSGQVFRTMIGDVTFDKKGDANSIYTMYVWKKGPDGRVSYYELGK